MSVPPDTVLCVAVRHGSEEDAARKLIGLRPFFDQFRNPRLAQLAPTPREGSSLWLDDIATAPHPVSIEAWWAILHSIDHLNAAYEMTVQEREGGGHHVTTRPFAMFPLLRASLENALRAGWLLGAESQKELVARRFRLIVTNARNFDEGLRLVPGVTQSPAYRETLEGLRDRAAAEGVSMTSLKQSAGPREIVRGGATALTGDPDGLEFIWRTLSGLTHGDNWAVRNFLDLERDEGAIDEETVRVATSSSIDVVATHMAICCRWTEAAVTLFVERARSLP